MGTKEAQQVKVEEPTRKERGSRGPGEPRRRKIAEPKRATGVAQVGLSSTMDPRSPGPRQGSQGCRREDAARGIDGLAQMEGLHLSPGQGLPLGPIIFLR
eukprot:7589068-Heterocapsa_arctica.AAC.1